MNIKIYLSKKKGQKYVTFYMYVNYRKKRKHKTETISNSTIIIMKIMTRNIVYICIIYVLKKNIIR